MESKDVFPPDSVLSVSAKDVLGTFRCMSESIRSVVICRSLTLNLRDRDPISQSENGFFAVDNLLYFLSVGDIEEGHLTCIESSFVCMSLELPSRLFKDSQPQAGVDSYTIGDSSIIWSTPSMLSTWRKDDTLPIRGDDRPVDCHADVSSAASRISKYMRIAKPLSATPTPTSSEEEPVEPIRVNLSRKRPRDAREFREQIIANGAQGEFYVWSLIKAKYGDAADLSWWLTSTKRTFFPSDYSPIDDSIGSDFFIPKDTLCLFATKRGGPVHIEVKGTGRFGGFHDELTFEISRNELQMSKIAAEKGEEYVVAVVSGLAGINRPKLETVIRDLSELDLVPTRFVATVPKARTVGSQRSGTTGPSLTKSTWY
jgi:hypothetical protein